MIKPREIPPKNIYLPLLSLSLIESTGNLLFEAIFRKKGFSLRQQWLNIKIVKN